MKAIERKAAQPAPSASGHWHLLLVVTVVSAGCGGQGLHANIKGSAPDGDAAAGTSGDGASGVATGGVTSLGGSADGQAGGATGGEVSVSPDALCDDASFWLAVTWVMNTGGPCTGTQDVGDGWGQIVLDSEGRAVDVTRFGTSQPREIDMLANERCPCLAGQTVPYTCVRDG